VDYVIPGNDDALRAIRLFTAKIADSAAEGVQLVSEKAFEAEVADVQQVEVSPELVGEEGEAVAVDASEVPETAVAEASAVDDDNVDLAAVLGGNIRKAPAAATEIETEPEVPQVATGA
jgi:small subunit ribosomal protein S2